MPIGVRIFVHCQATPDDLEGLRDRFCSHFGLQADDFYVGGPLTEMKSEDETLDVLLAFAEGGQWLDINLWRSYYSTEYARGDIALFARCADWIEANIPGSFVVYGNDISDYSFKMFDIQFRNDLLAYHKTNPTVYRRL